MILRLLKERGSRQTSTLPTLNGGSNTRKSYNIGVDWLTVDHTENSLTNGAACIM